MKAIIELQKRAMDSSTDIVELVGYAYAIAYKLDLQDFVDWCNAELEGYREHSAISIPKYRCVTGTIMIYFSDGCKKPYASNDDKMNTRNIFDGLSYLQRISGDINGWLPMELDCKILQFIREAYNKDEQGYSKDNAKLGMLCNNSFSIDIKKLIEGLTSIYSVYLSVHYSEIKRIFGAIQKTILDWTLDCEKQGILGEGLEFTKEEKASGTKYYL